MKYDDIKTKVNATESRAPRGARGLKLFFLVILQAVATSRPSRGAWIEILLVVSGSSIIMVAPLAGRVD